MQCCSLRLHTCIFVNYSYWMTLKGQISHWNFRGISVFYKSNMHRESYMTSQVTSRDLTLDFRVTSYSKTFKGLFFIKSASNAWSFMKHYTSEIPPSSKSYNFFLGNNSNAPSIFFTPTDREEILNIINNMKPKTSQGIDNISSEFL